jgi:hypothetical protein
MSEVSHVSTLLSFGECIQFRVAVLCSNDACCSCIGDAKVFDFGLAKELKPKDLVSPPDGYEASGMTGSVRNSFSSVLVT